MAVKSIAWEEIEEGDQLPALIKEVTATTVIYGAFASRDFSRDTMTVILPKSRA